MFITSVIKSRFGLLSATASLLCLAFLNGCANESSTETAEEEPGKTTVSETASSEAPPIEETETKSENQETPKVAENEEPAPEEEPVAHDAWISNYKDALAEAKAGNKDILMNFTGSDWCVWCIRLHEEVFDDKQFADYADKNLVLLELDFPQDSSRITPEIKAQNQDLQERFSIQGFPSVLLLDSSGRPYAQTGYQPGGAPAYIEHLEEHAQARKERDAAFTEADDLEGVERASKLDEGLKALPEELVFPEYEEVVSEIVKLDPENEAGLKQEYEEKLLRSKLVKRFQKMQSDLQSGGDIEGALAELDKIDEEFADFPQAQRQTNMFRLQLFQMDPRKDRTAEVVKLADAMLADENITGDERLPFFGAKLNTLAQAKKYEDGIAVADQMFKEFSDDQRLAVQILIAKANMLVELKKGDDARKVLDQAREIADDDLKSIIDRTEEQLFEDEDGPTLLEESEEESDAPAEAESSEEESSTEEKAPAEEAESEETQAAE